VPENDPMTMVNGAFSQWKTNLYRIGVDQPLVIGGLSQPFRQSRDGGQQADTPANFCANMLDSQTAFLAANAARFEKVSSPVPSAGNSLLTFMAARLSASFASLHCAEYGLKNTVRLSTDTDGVATAASFRLKTQAPKSQASTPSPAVAASPWPVPTVSQSPRPRPTSSAGNGGGSGSGSGQGDAPFPWWDLP
jgi:hypothetical protein